MIRTCYRWNCIQRAKAF